MKHSVLLFICFLLSIQFVQSKALNLLAEKTSPDLLKSELLSDRKWVPYPSYADREGWKNLMGENYEQVVKRGEAQLKYEWKVIKATDYLAYERTGDRMIMQNPNSNNNNALTALVMAELAEGKGRFMDQIINGVFYNCERTSWVLSAHLTAQKSKRTLPDYTEQVIDLGSGDLGGFLAWTYYFFHQEFDKVNPIISQRLRQSLYDRIITPYRERDNFWWMGFKPREDGLVNNWNPWCNFNVLQCVLLLENDKDQLSKDVYKTMLSVDKFINYVHTDGACEEGPSYWGHAAGKLYDYLKVLSLSTEGKVSLFDHQMIRDMGEYIPRSYVGEGWVVNFADASAQFSSDAGLIYRYGEAVKSIEMKTFASLLVKSGKNPLTHGLDIFRTIESLMYFDKIKTGSTALITPEAIEYPETQFYYLKNKSGFFLASKGGHNAESHNHNDIGTFSLYYKQYPVLIDVGVGTYTRQTFGEERYSIFTMRSLYHNLPAINGVEQKEGRQYKAKNVQFNAKGKTLSIEIADSYPSKANVSSWIRSYLLKDSELEIRDQFALKSADKENEINFMLWGKVEVNERGKVKIKVNGNNFELLYDSNLFTLALETIPLDDSRLSNVWGKEIYRVTLKANTMALKGTYSYKIKVVN